MSLRLPFNVRLRSERLLLREFTLADAPAYFAYRRLPQVTQYVPEEPLVTVVEAEEVLGRVIARQFATPRHHLLLAIALRQGDGPLMGEVGLHTLKGDELSAELGFMLAPAYWGRGYAFEAAQAILQFGREEAGWRRFMATCDVDNAASARILTKLGLQQTAYLPRHYQKNGAWRHSLQFEMGTD